MSSKESPDPVAPVPAWVAQQREAACAGLQRFCRQPSIAAQIQPGVLPRIAGAKPLAQLCGRYSILASGGAGVGHAGSRVHASNENIKLDDFIQGIQHVAALLAELAGGAPGH
jgi:hypothetical protein